MLPSLHRELQCLVDVFGLVGRRRLPVGSSEDAVTSHSDEHEEDARSDPPCSPLDPRAADSQRPAQVNTHTPAQETTGVSPGNIQNGPGVSGVFVSRLVNEGHVPYVNAYEELPDEMKLEGKDALIFKVEVRNLSVDTESILLSIM